MPPNVRTASNQLLVQNETANVCLSRANGATNKRIIAEKYKRANNVVYCAIVHTDCPFILQKHTHFLLK